MTSNEGGCFLTYADGLGNKYPAQMVIVSTGSWGRTVRTDMRSSAA